MDDMSNRPAPDEHEHDNRHGIARGCAAVAVMLCAAAWLLFLWTALRELSGVADQSFRGSYVVAGIMGALAMIATAVAGRLGTHGGANVGWVDLRAGPVPTWWGMHIALVMATS
ncbi:hypothetical protein LX14_001081 [Williamsia deligens]|nr:hypothetical protein [Williamsia deligens]